MNTFRTRLAAAVVGVGLAVAVPAAAWAGPRRPVSSTPTTASSAPTNPSNPTNTGTRDLETLRAKCLAAIDVRLPALAAARADAVGSQHVTDDHQAALTTNIDETTARLRTLADEIKAATDLV
ncbi:MAG: hypothetical protein QOD57_1500, partial [Actinomycetota bacterium]|nr:hypothetical protein [Actinomycetota bacterium]